MSRNPIQISVAPMEGVTIFPIRLWLALAARPTSMTTPFLRVTKDGIGNALPAGFAPELFALRGALPYELTPQLLTADADAFLLAADLLPPAVSPYIELNCGCPAPSSAGKNAGSGMLRDPSAFGATVEKIASSLGPGRFAVKMRLGYDSPDELTGLLPHVTSLPLARLTVHGRTRAQGYRGQASWSAIQTVALQAAAPTWASGDVVGSVSLARLGEEAPDITGAMIGRGLIQNPWIFEELRTGECVRLAPAALANALICFAVLNDLWMRSPEKLIARVASGRITSYCGTDADAWEKLAASLTSLAFGVPRVALSGREQGPLPVSPTAFGRVRYLWSSLRSSLPEPFAAARAMRARRLEDLLEFVFAAATEALTQEDDELLTLSAERCLLASIPSGLI